LAHIPVHRGKDFDAYVGEEERKKIGHKKWSRRVEKVIAILDTVLNYDHLYIGGGNSRRVQFALPRHVSLVSNDAGMEGGAFAWHPKGPRKPAGTRRGT
jgi:polyphosphate glucokinase